ncbi:XRE family transcriptional regulator [Bacillus marasmi]|uniref:XRE family transcriptional regulator n=1 Tax=Bacillus marasmi TaxID=1926279 RepID=UPI0011C96CD1|nr:XRE family transcriptional regulator [Bacillus marasmi]
MKHTANQEIRHLIKSKGYSQWEAGEFLGFGESVFSRMLRKELNSAQKEDLMSKLQKLEERQ